MKPGPSRIDKDDDLDRKAAEWLALEKRDIDIERPATAAELARLERVIDQLSDEALERIASALAGRL